MANMENVLQSVGGTLEKLADAYAKLAVFDTKFIHFEREKDELKRRVDVLEAGEVANKQSFARITTIIGIAGAVFSIVFTSVTAFIFTLIDKI